jgi:hypothetical protein
VRLKKRSTLEILAHLCSSLRARMFTAIIAPAFWSVGLGSCIVPPHRFSNLHLIRLGQGVVIHWFGWLLTVANAGRDESPKISIGIGAGECVL